MQKKTKQPVLLIWPFYPPDSGAAAARGESFYEYITKKTNNTCSVITTTKMKSYIEKDNFFRLPVYFTLKPAQFFNTLTRIISIVIKVNPSIIIVSVPSIVLGLHALIVSIFFRKRLIVDSRDILIDQKNKVLKNFIWNICFYFSKAILVTTESQRILISNKYKIKKDKITLIPNGVSSQLLNFKNENNIIKFDLVFLGTLVPERDLDKLEEFIDILFRKKQNISIAFIGVDYLNENTKLFANKLIGKKYGNKISFFQELPQKEAFLLACQGKIGLVSIRDGKEASYQIPAKIYEYFAAGLAISALMPEKAIEIKKILETTATGIYSSEPDILAKKTIDLLNNDKLLKKYNLNSKRVASNYDRLKFLSTLDKIIYE